MLGIGRRVLWMRLLVSLCAGCWLLLLSGHAAAQAEGRDPFADAGEAAPASSDSAAPASAPVDTSAALAPATTAAPTEGSPLCERLTSNDCSQQNNGLLAIAAGYVVVCSLLATLWRAWWNKRGTSGAGVRLMVPMLTAATAAGVLEYFDPAGADNLKCCLADHVLRGEIFLSDSAIGRAFLFGVIPVLVLYLLVATIVGLVKK